MPFDSSYAPGPEDLRYRRQPGLGHDRARRRPSTSPTATTSSTRRSSPLADNPVAKRHLDADLAKYRFGAQTGTTSYKTITDVIKPTAEASVYDSNDAAIAGLKAKQIDAIVVDLPTAFYMAAAQLDNGKVVGQFPAPTGADAEHFSVVLPKGSALTTCINGAIKAI